MRLAAPDDFVTRPGILAAADIAAQLSDKANGSTQSLGSGYAFFLA